MKKFTKNIGTKGRLIRAGVGVAFLIAAYFFTDMFAKVLSVIGIIYIFSAAISWCPICQLTGKNTYKKK